MEDTAKQPGVMFDTKLVELIRPAIDESFIQHGDVLRSMLVVYDYHGALNDAPDLNKAVWLGPQGAQQDPAGIIGSLGATGQAMAHMLDRAFSLRDALREDFEEKVQTLTNTLAAIEERTKELEQLENEIKSLQGDSGGATDPAKNTAE